MKVTLKGVGKIKEYPKLSTLNSYELFEVMDGEDKGWIGFRVYAGEETVVWLMDCDGGPGWDSFETVKDWKVRKLDKKEIVELRNG